MDILAFLQPVIDFFNNDIGRVVLQVLRAIYAIISPSNTDAAHPVPIPA
ncbi:hypothetical protein [Corynebacterium spheniscorum]|nr:hypothetical protein [Corynebacterium spheniscorum]